VIRSTTAALAWAFFVALTACPATALRHAPLGDSGRWGIIKVDAPGPYVDLVSGPDGAMWLTSKSLAGFIRVDASEKTTIFRTPGFRPSYITNGGDGRVWAVDTGRRRAVGALTTSGQLTIYVQPPTIDALAVAKVVPDLPTTIVFATTGQIALMSSGGQMDSNAFAYPSGLKANDQVAMISLPKDDIWFTECCLSNQGIAGNAISFFSLIVEHPLPYAQCAHPAGIAADGQGNIYVACPGHGNSIVAIVNPTTGATTSMPFPVDYATMVNTELGASNGNVYFTPGTSARLWEFVSAKQQFVSYATPDGSIPTAIAPSTDSAHLWLLAGSRRQVDVFRL
jgi:streptogramin lyase